MHRMVKIGMRSAYGILPGLLAGLLAGAEPSAPPRPILESDDAVIERPRTLTPERSDRQPAGRSVNPTGGPSKPSAAGGAGSAPRQGGTAPGNGPGGRTAAGSRTSGPAAAAERTAPPPPSIEHDTVILVNEQRFRGTVLAAQPDPAWVAINTGTGTLRLPRDTVLRVEYGLTARMGQVKATDLAGLVDLARWCRANGRNPEALQLMTKAVALPGCDTPSRGLYATLVDELDGADKALPLYIGYRNAGGDEPAILARLAELQAARSAWEEQMRALGLDPGASAAAGTPMPAATASAVEEGYERYKWDPDQPAYSAPATIALTTLVTPEGPRRVMDLTVQPHPTNTQIDKAAIVMRRPLTLKGRAKLGMLVANRGSEEIRIGIAVKTGQEWTYFESRPQLVKPTDSGKEFQQLTFDLGASDFKSKATNWDHTAAITGLDQVRELQILVHNGRRDASLWIAGIAFEGGE